MSRAIRRVGPVRVEHPLREPVRDAWAAVLIIVVVICSPHLTTQTTVLAGIVAALFGPGRTAAVRGGPRGSAVTA